MTISTWIHDLLDSIKHLIVTDSKLVVDFIKPFIQTVLKDGGKILIAAAENAVTIGMATSGDGATKMAAALASFSAEVIAKEVPFIESEARALIELALQKVKASTVSA